MASYFFLKLVTDFFGFKTFPPMSLNFCKVGFPDKVTGLWAFEEHLSYQKYQGPPRVVA